MITIYSPGETKFQTDDVDFSAAEEAVFIGIQRIGGDIDRGGKPGPDAIEITFATDCGFYDHIEMPPAERDDFMDAVIECLVMDWDAEVVDNP